MWKIKIVFIFFLLFVPRVVRAKEPTDFRCVCNYKQIEDPLKTCAESPSDDFIVLLGSAWSLNKFEPGGQGGWKKVKIWVTLL